MTKPWVVMITDGSCLGNPGPGGYACILRAVAGPPEVSKGAFIKEQVLTGHEDSTTNNRMELMAVIVGLEALKRPCQVLITLDSEYVWKGIDIWLKNWLAKNWRTSDKKPVKNRDLWERLIKAKQDHDITWDWTRGHSGHPLNERCDELANAAARRKS